MSISTIAGGGGMGKTWQAIDSMVFTDDDGQSYLYWGRVPRTR